MSQIHEENYIKNSNINLKLFLNIGKILIFFILILAFANLYLQGFSYDESFHDFLGMFRFQYLKTFGEFKNYEFSQVDKFYPGLSDTIIFVIIYLLKLININFVQENIDIIKHTIILFFSFMSLYGLYLVVKKIFNYEIAIFSLLFTIFNPFFFGHISINQKDIMIFFSFIWSIYFFIKYLGNQNKNYYNIIIFSIFVGFGCGVRVTFLATLIPILLIGFFYLFVNFNKFNIKKIIFFDIPSSILLIFLLTVICWPQFWEKGFLHIINTIIDSIVWPAGPRLWLVNGFMYETTNTPKDYFLLFLFYRMPIFLSILFLTSFILIIIKNDFFKKNFIEFNKKFLLLIFVFFFPIFIAVAFRVKIYDNIRLFLFELPLFSIFCSLTFLFVINHLHTKIIKLFSIILLILFLFFSYRFISLNPYQYSYVNYYFMHLINSQNKFEHDYWGTSFKELILKIKKKHPKQDYENYKIVVCGGDEFATIHYLKKYLNLKSLIPYESLNKATHIIMTNRAIFDIHNKRTCFQMFPGKDIEVVERNGLVLSVFRELKKTN